MRLSTMQEIMRAMAANDLPLRPGDLLFLQSSSDMVLLITCDSQSAQREMPGQQVSGIITNGQHSKWCSAWLAWDGHGKVWKVHRTV